jgi:hypothetical protein
MTPKPSSSTPKATALRPVRKILKGATETASLFIDVTDVIRRTQAMPLTRYVE